MLTDSKVRQAGFIRTSSSKKILPPPRQQFKNNSSDDSFSSFQYEKNIKQSRLSNQNHIKTHQSNNDKQFSIKNDSVGKWSNRNSKNDSGLKIKTQQSNQNYKNTKNQSYRQKEKVLESEQQQNKIVKKPLTPQIPKPNKKTQPSFQNQKLRNNFFNHQELNKQSRQSQSYDKNVNKNGKRQNQVIINSRQIPRTNTPQFKQFTKFNEQKINKDLESVQLICDRIGNMKLQGNFSFNPKMQKINKNQKQDKIIKSSDSQNQQKTQTYYKNQSNSSKQVKKVKKNNYFADQTKFKYDFEQDNQQSSSENDSQNQDNLDNQSQQSLEKQQKERRLSFQKRKKQIYQNFKKNQSGSQSDQQQEQKNSSDSSSSLDEDQAMKYYQKQKMERNKMVQEIKNNINKASNNSKKGGISYEYPIKNKIENQEQEDHSKILKRNNGLIKSKVDNTQLRKSSQKSNNHLRQQNNRKNQEPQQSLIIEYDKTQFKGSLLQSQPYKQNNRSKVNIDPSNNPSGCFSQKSNAYNSLTQNKSYFNKQSAHNEDLKKRNSRQEKIYQEQQESQQQYQQHLHHQKKQIQQKNYMFATNGGVCFDVDVKQFNFQDNQRKAPISNYPPSQTNNRSSGSGPQIKKKKKNPKAQKQELLKRRQLAKIYSKQARFRLFGFA